MTNRVSRTATEIFLQSTWAFMLRETKARYFNTRLGLVWAVLDPAAIIVLLVIIHGYIRGGADPAKSVEFFFWPVWAFFMFSQPVNAATGAITASRGLMSYRQIQPIDVILARCVIEWSLLLMVGVIAISGWWLAGFTVHVENPLGIAFYPICLLFLGVGYGLLSEVASVVFPDARRVFAIAMRPLLFLSGLFFTMDIVPPDLQPWLFWNPVLHLVDLMRDAAAADYQSPGSLAYALYCAAGISLIGLALYHYFHDILQQP